MDNDSPLTEMRLPGAGSVLTRAFGCDARHRKRRPQNISQNERTFSTLGGAALLWLGIARGRLSGVAMSLGGAALLYRGWTGHCHTYSALGIDTSPRNPATTVPAQQGAKVEKTIAVNRPREELYTFWRKLENLPQVMQHLERVETGEGTGPKNSCGGSCVG